MVVMGRQSEDGRFHLVTARGTRACRCPLPKGLAVVERNREDVSLCEGSEDELSGELKKLAGWQAGRGL